MTSRRRIKKEIDYAVSDLILDCITYTNLYQKPNDEDALQIVQDTLLMRNQLRNQANHPEQKDNSQTSKGYFDNIAKTLIEGIDSGYGKLGKLVKKDQ